MSQMKPNRDYAIRKGKLHSRRRLQYQHADDTKTTAVYWTNIMDSFRLSDIVSRRIRIFRNMNMEYYYNYTSD